MNASTTKLRQWTTLNPLTHMVETGDGTQVSVEVTDSVDCLADILRICQIRDDQRRKEVRDGSG